MKNPLKFILLIVILILLFFIYQYYKPQSIINEVTLMHQEDDNKEISQHNKTLEKSHVVEKSLVDKKQEIFQLIENSDKKISYLTAYRELLHFRKCMMIYYNSQKGIDLMSHYIDNYFSFSDTHTKPNETQIQYYQIYIDDCYSLLLSKDEKVEEAGSRLAKRFKSIEPETNDEIALSEALEFDKRINEIFFKIYHEKSGKNKLREDQKKAIMKKRLALIKELSLIRSRNKGNMTAEDSLLIKEIMNEIIKLNSLEGHEADQEELAYLEKELLKYTNDLKMFFKDNQTPDIFLIFADHLLNEQMGKFYFTEDINEKLGIYDTQYINTLNKIIVPFIACSLEYPCGPDSSLSIKHCIEPLGTEPLACGKNVIDYYLEDLISPNQMIDFNNYFNYIMDNHAQL